MNAPGPRFERRLRLRIIVAAGGAIAGFAVSSLIYLLANPLLESSSGLVRELQGPLWNLVPLLTLAGALAGWLSTRHHPEGR